MASAPKMLTTQPITALMPSGPRLTGNMKMPDPIIEPTTSPPVIHTPSWRAAIGCSAPTEHVSQLTLLRANRPASGADRPGGREVPLHDRNRRRRISRGCPIAAARLGSELGDVVQVIVDHVAAHFMIEGAATKALQHNPFGPRLRSQRRGDAQVEPGGDPLRLGETVAMVAHQHRAKLANLWASAAILDNPPERHFGEIAADGIREKHRRGCGERGC